MHRTGTALISTRALIAFVAATVCALGLPSAAAAQSQDPFASAADVPVAGDIDGDGRTDIVIFRAGAWLALTSRSGFTAQTAFSWGLAGDGPGKDGETEVDDRGIERVHGVGQVDGERFIDIEGARRPNQSLRDVGVDAPVAGLVGISQRRSRDPCTDADVIQLGL